MKRIVVGVSGASGMPLAVTLLNALACAAGVETHLIVSGAAEKVLSLESGLSVQKLTELADVCHDVDNIGAAPASGSWRHSGMIICPCSMSTLGAVANGIGSNLIHRAADVTLKERKPLILVPRETPLSRVHLRNMLAAQEAGATIMPPCPGFYSRPETIQDILNHLAGRMLDHLEIEHELCRRWDGMPSADA
ncbi:UbiX family flavin prenyltransferase [Oleidesulfovibrio sp.]|uniref:UbiX family flavin prenyltransferase n=1 Tax=Oleidesulfovibrio sp. TaxID=2909707 RepID=UPI003A8C1164